MSDSLREENSERKELNEMLEGLAALIEWQEVGAAIKNEDFIEAHKLASAHIQKYPEHHDDQMQRQRFLGSLLVAAKMVEAKKEFEALMMRCAETTENA